MEERGRGEDESRLSPGGDGGAFPGTEMVVRGLMRDSPVDRSWYGVTWTEYTAQCISCTLTADSLSLCVTVADNFYSPFLNLKLTVPSMRKTPSQTQEIGSSGTVHSTRDISALMEYIHGYICPHRRTTPLESLGIPLYLPNAAHRVN